MSYESPYAKEATKKAKPAAYKSPYGNGLAADSGHTPQLPAPLAKGLSWIMDKMARPGEAAMHVYAQPDARHPDLGGAARVFLHGEAPQQYEADTETAINETGLGKPYQRLPGWGRTIARTVLQTAGDPTTYIGGSGLSRKAVEAASAHALPLAMRVGEKAAVKAGGNRTAQAFLSLPTHLHNFITPGGEPAAHAAREFARTLGPKGEAEYQKVYALHNATEARGADLTGRLVQRYRGAVNGLEQQQETDIYRAIAHGTINKLPPELRSRAETIRDTTQAVAYLRGSGKVRSTLLKDGFKLPDELQAYDAPVARGVQRFNQFRKDYLPLPHDLDPEDAQRILAKIESGKGGGVNLTSTADKHLKRRASNEQEILDNPEIYRDAMESALRSGARTTVAHDLKQTLAKMYAPTRTVTRRLKPPGADQGELFDPKRVGLNLGPVNLSKFSPSVQAVMRKASGIPGSAVGTTQRFQDVPGFIKDYFKPPQQPARTGFAQTLHDIGGGAREASNLGKATLFDVPMPHMRNISWLTLLHEPGAIPGVIANYAKMRAGLGGAARRDAVVGEAQAAGAAHAPNLEQSGLVKVLQQLGPGGRAAAKVYDASGKMLWGFDDAAKTAVWNRYKKRYKDPLIAAYHAQRDLVDYARTSPLSEAARAVMPFATWRTQLPASVVRGIAKNPQNALMLDRLTQGEAFGAQKTLPDGSTEKMTTPLAEGLQPFQDPAAFARGSMGPSAKVLTSDALQAVLAKFDPHASDYAKHWMTYGERDFPNKKKNGKWDAGFIANQLPFLGQLLQYTGNGMFSESGADALDYLLTGREHYNRPAAPPKAQSKTASGGLFPELRQ